jgi:hypothetical protein
VCSRAAAISTWAGDHLSMRVRAFPCLLVATVCRVLQGGRSWSPRRRERHHLQGCQRPNEQGPLEYARGLHPRAEVMALAAGCLFLARAGLRLAQLPGLPDAQQPLVPSIPWLM